MKKTINIFTSLSLMIMVLISSVTVSAQIIKTMPKVPAPSLSPPKVVVSRTMGNYPNDGVKINVFVVMDPNKGATIKFTSNVAIDHVEITGSEPKLDMQTTSYNENSTTGYFYINSPAYNGSNTYILRFYVKGKPKGVWTAAIQRKTT